MIPQHILVDRNALIARRYPFSLLCLSFICHRSQLPVDLIQMSQSNALPMSMSMQKPSQLYPAVV